MVKQEDTVRIKLQGETTKCASGRRLTPAEKRALMDEVIAKSGSQPKAAPRPPQPQKVAPAPAAVVGAPQRNVVSTQEQRREDTHERLVWAKVTWFPWWPATARRMVGAHQHVRFFAWRGQVATLPDEQVREYESQPTWTDPKVTLGAKKKSMRSSFCAAVTDAQRWLEDFEASQPRRSKREAKVRDLEAETEAYLGPGNSEPKAMKPKVRPRGEG